jgi:long-chain acyl-CoA synthetase
VARLEPESRRRLQGTLLTCSIYRRDDEPPAAAEVVLLTADSSGDPKGVMRTAENLITNCENLAKSLDVTAENRILTTVPLFAAYGFDLGLCLALKYGATLYLEDEVAPKRIVKLVREQEIDLLPATPPLYAALAKLPTARPLKTKGAAFLATGSLLSETTAESFRERWGVRVLPMYHTTEAGAISVDRKGLAPETVGKAIAGVDLRMGPPDAEGRCAIWVRSGAVASHSVGSLSAPTQGQGEKKGKKGATKLAATPVGSIDAEGFLRTGDLGRLDKNGRLSLMGREDDLVKVEGKRVALGEVEGCLESFPKVKSAQARVYTDEQGSSMVVASVVVSSRCQAEEIIDHCAKNLAPYKVPRRIEFVVSPSAQVASSASDLVT